MKSTKLDAMSKDELIELVQRLRKRKKYGLVWEDKLEDVVTQCQRELPVLEEVADRAIHSVDDQPTNIIIEGDNYHALSVLNYTHKGKIDVIYIDPPYNTGAKDWKYNNDYVDENDAFRHSKWIALMNHRLQISRHLLKPDGVLIVTIDDYEFCALGLLLDELFPDKTRATVVIKYNPAGTARNGFSRNHEYALFLLNPGQEIEKRTAPSDIRDQNLRRHGSASNRHESPTMFYPIYVNKKTLAVMGVGQVPTKEYHPQKHTIEKDEYFEVWPIDDKNVEKRWYYGKERVAMKGNRELSCKWIRDRLHVYFHTDNQSEQKYPSVWIGSEYDSGAHGGSLVRDMVGVQFPFPKSLFAVKDCLNAIVKNNKKAIVLDYFAGSGTTGHAVMQLNKEDGGNRQFILCTNNENKIAEEVTYPRIKKVTEGYADVEGIPANVRYFRTAFVPRSDVSDDTRYALVERSADMICVREGTYEKVSDTKQYKIFTDGHRTTGILYDLEVITAFKKALTKHGLPASLYIFTLSADAYEDEFRDLKIKHKLCPIPESILEVYRKLFRPVDEMV